MEIENPNGGSSPEADKPDSPAWAKWVFLLALLVLARWSNPTSHEYGSRSYWFSTAASVGVVLALVGIVAVPLRARLRKDGGFWQYFKKAKTSEKTLLLVAMVYVGAVLSFLFFALVLM